MKLNILIIGAIFMAACSSQKENIRQAPVSDLVEMQSYTFVAQSALPTESARYNPRVMFPNGSQLYQLDGRYDLKVTPDSVIAFLPYFGRAYTAPINPNEGGIKFTSTDFGYKKSIRKNNYEIEITPRDDREVRNLYLTISPGGYASLRVLLNNKTPITFSGELKPDNY